MVEGTPLLREHTPKGYRKFESSRLRQIQETRIAHGVAGFFIEKAFEAELLGMSQSPFAVLLGVSVRTLQEWEQCRREPSGAAKTLLKIAVAAPELVRLSA